MENNSLIVSEKYLETLKPSIRSFIELKLDTKYSELTEPLKKKFCLDLITVAFAETGVSKENITEDILKYQALNQLYGELSGKFGYLSCSEIKKAFNLGVRHEFGPYMGLNGVTYNKFLKGFCEMPERITAMRELNKITDKPTEMIYTEQEKQQIMITSCLNTFYDYKSGKKLENHNWRLYDFLVNKLGFEIETKSGAKIKTLITDQDKRNEIKNNAKKEYEDYVKKYSTNLRFEGKHEEARNILKVLDDLSNNRSYDNYQKKWALQYYFDALILTQTDLKTLLL